MKIAIVGTHSSSKTTLAYALALHYKNMDKSVQVVTESARRCPFDLASLEGAKWMLFTLLKEEVEAEQGHQVIICDRSSADVIAYRRASGQEFPAYLEELALSHLESYDKIIYLKPSRRIVDDGFRDVNEDYRRDVKEEFDKIFGEGRIYVKGETTIQEILG